MKHICTFTTDHYPDLSYDDHLIVTLPQDADDWAGLPPDDYLSVLKRHGYLPLTVSGPFPDSAELTRLMQTTSMDDACDYVLSASQASGPRCSPASDCSKRSFMPPKSKEDLHRVPMRDNSLAHPPALFSSAIGGFCRQR